MRAEQPEEIIQKINAGIPGASVQSKRKQRIEIRVPPDKLVESTSFLKEKLDFDLLVSVGGVDYPEEGKIELLYQMWSTSAKVLAIVRTDVQRDSPEIPTITGVYAAANWHERETWELLGVNFLGHGSLKRFLLPEDWDKGYPLRKEFKLSEEL